MSNISMLITFGLLFIFVKLPLFKLIVTSDVIAENSKFKTAQKSWNIQNCNIWKNNTHFL